jgi:glucose/arabinose dehydrogenase
VPIRIARTWFWRWVCPAESHNGGQIGFGPDGYLYVALGMGGGNGDPEGNAQNLGTLLGSILRIDVSSSEGGRPYRIPVDNPFIDDPDARDEIGAYGFRNPRRFAFDEQTGRLWAGDVGQGEAGIGQPGFEEIDLVEPCKNYGCVVIEGFQCYPPPDTVCSRADLEPPVTEYQLYKDGHCAVIGGRVYRAAEFPEWQGVYFYGDFCSGNIRGLWYDEGVLADYGLLKDTELPTTAFGRDTSGTRYVLPREGQIHKLVSK